MTKTNVLFIIIIVKSCLISDVNKLIHIIRVAFHFNIYTNNKGPLSFIYYSVQYGTWSKFEPDVNQIEKYNIIFKLDPKHICGLNFIY